MDEPLLSYTIASADMRYIEVGERLIFLRQDSTGSPVLRGEFAGCGSDCYIDLNQIFLEYALSCEGCPDQLIAADRATRFGARLARLLTQHICTEDPTVPSAQRLSNALCCVLSSMDVPFTEERSPQMLRYTLAYSPIHVAAKYSGTARAIGVASQTLHSLCKGIIRFMAPEWRLLVPLDEEWTNYMREIAISS